jgi:PKD repeat protein
MAVTDASRMKTVLRLRVGLLCAGFLFASNVGYAQTDLSRIAYTEYRWLLCEDVECDYTCDYYYYPCLASFVSAPNVPPEYVSGKQPTWSPDRASIAVFVAGERLIKFNVATGNYENIGYTAFQCQFDRSCADPAWSSDGSQIAFVDTSGISVMRPADGIGRRLTDSTVARVGRPMWSPDSARIAFSCVWFNSDSWDICVMNRDGTGLVRLTTDSAFDSDPAWSPDGARIAFVTTRFDGIHPFLAVMDADGTVSEIGSGIEGRRPDWSPDGARIAFTVSEACDFPDCEPLAIYTTTPDGAVVTRLVSSAADPAWMPIPAPVATFTLTCNGNTCDFDASASKDNHGTITGYSWNFGDGTTGEGATPTHTYVDRGSYTVTLTVTDHNGAGGTNVRPITVGPVASFTFTCGGLTCDFDGSGSKALGGTVSRYVWDFGDGLIGEGAGITHTYTVGNLYSVTLTIIDSTGATNTQTRTVNRRDQPVASFTFFCNALFCSFDGSASQDVGHLGGTIASHTWDFGDGITGAGIVVTHRFLVASSYNVTLTVTDTTGATSTQSQRVKVDVQPLSGDLDGDTFQDLV